MDHDEVAKRAAMLIKKIHSCTIGALDFSGGWSKERVDAILFNSMHSFVIEAKVSRSDFLSDAKKPFRQDPSTGLGKFRYYACPNGLIKQDEVPEKWGLIYINEGRLRPEMPTGFGGHVRTRKTQKCPRYGYDMPVFETYGNYKEQELFRFDDRCMEKECAYLYHLATRYKNRKFMENIL